MRKINKIMMMTVAILLSLVLITSSVVSGTLAKYTTSSSASDSARVAKWGVTVEASYGETFRKVVNNENETVDERKVKITPAADGIGVTITNLRMAPGDDFSDAIRFSISGKPEVALRVNIAVEMSYINDLSKDKTQDKKANFVVAESFGGLKANTAFVPFGFTCGLSKDGVTPTYENSSIIAPGMGSTIGKTYAQNIDKKILVKGENTSKSPYGAYIDFAPNVDVELTAKDKSFTSNVVYMGFYWPFEYENAESGITKAEFNDISTWLLKNRNPEFNITYSVTIEQIKQIN